MLYYDSSYSLSDNYKRVHSYIELKEKKKLVKFDSQEVSL